MKPPVNKPRPNPNRTSKFTQPEDSGAAPPLMLCAVASWLSAAVWPFVAAWLAHHGPDWIRGNAAWSIVDGEYVAVVSDQLNVGGLIGAIFVFCAFVVSGVLCWVAADVDTVNDDSGAGRPSDKTECLQIQTNDAGRRRIRELEGERDYWRTKFCRLACDVRILSGTPHMTNILAQIENDSRLREAVTDYDKQNA